MSFAEKIRRPFLKIACGVFAGWLALPVPVLAEASRATNDDLAVAYSNYLKTTKGILDIRIWIASRWR